MITLETDRLSITPFSQKDGSLLHRIFTDETVRKFLWDDVYVQAAEKTVISQVLNIPNQVRVYVL